MSGNTEEPNPTSETEPEQPKDAPVMGQNGRPIFFYSHVKEQQRAKSPDGKESNDDVGIAEFYQFAAIASGAVCFFFRYKLCAWLCLLLFYSSIINFKFEHMMQQGTTSFTLVTVAFTQSYMAAK